MTKQNNKLQTKGSIRKLRTGAVVSTLATSVILVQQFRLKRLLLQMLLRLLRLLQFQKRLLSLLR